MKKEDQDRDLRRLWLERPEAKRTFTDRLGVTSQPEQNRPDLLRSSNHGDPYQQLETILRAYITPDPPPPYIP